jgi:hypothetical protein
VCTELGLVQCYSHRPGVGFRPRITYSSHAPPVGSDRAALALAYNLCELNTEGFLFTFSSLCFPSPAFSTFPQGCLRRNDLRPGSMSLLDLRAGALRYPSGLSSVVSLRPHALPWMAHTW